MLLMSQLHGFNASGEHDPYWGSVISLWDATTTADAKGGTWVPNGGAYLSGGKAILPTVLSDRYELAVSVTLGDAYTIEGTAEVFDENLSPYTNNNHIIFGSTTPFGSDNCPSFGFRAASDGSLSYIWLDFAGTASPTSTLMTLGAHRWALVYQKPTMKLYWDGIEIGSVTATNFNPTLTYVYLGYRGWLGYNLTETHNDDFRFTNNVARFTGNHTPPPTPFPTSL